MNKGTKIFLNVLKWIGIVLAAVLCIALIFVAVLCICEYRPKSEEKVSVNGQASKTLSEGDTITVLSWNTGYCALGETADFFMDGGTHVSTSTKAQVKENIEGIASVFNSVKPDVAILQEIDISSKRSHKINEKKELLSRIKGYQDSYALNYKVLYVPYPLPTIGKVSCGLLSLSDFNSTESKRIALPCPFTWPMRVCNLKRCLLINRIPLENSSKELVVVNLHLEAYDSGEGKIAQTKLLRSILEEEAAKGNYVIAGGDFNQAFSNMDNSAYPAVSDEMWIPGIIDVSEFQQGLTFIQDNSVPSCRSLDKPYAGADKNNFQYYMIDGFIVSPNVKVEQVNTLDMQFKNSDHNPVVMKVTLE